MEIKIISDLTLGAKPYWIRSDQTLQEDDLSADFSRDVEEVKHLRAAGVENEDRGNASVDLTVVIWKNFTNLRDCGLFLLDLGNEVPATGRVEITITDSNGLKGQRIIEHASIPRITPRKMGTSCQVTFHIHGGIVTKTPIAVTTS